MLPLQPATSRRLKRSSSRHRRQPDRSGFVYLCSSRTLRPTQALQPTTRRGHVSPDSGLHPDRVSDELNAIAALILVRGADFLSLVDQPQCDILARLFLRLHGHGFDIAGIFWGLWLFPLGLLVYRSRFLPRLLGVGLMVNCFAYPINSFMALVVPQY